MERGARVCVFLEERKREKLRSGSVGSEGEGVSGASGGRESVGRSYNRNNHRVGASAD